MPPGAARPHELALTLPFLYSCLLPGRRPLYVPLESLSMRRSLSPLHLLPLWQCPTRFTSANIF